MSSQPWLRGKRRPGQATVSLQLWLRVYSQAYGSGRAPNPHVVPTSLTWRNPPSNPPGSYLSSGGGPRRRRRAVAGAAAAAQGAAGIPRTAGWDGRPEPRFSPRGGKACGSGGLPGDVPPTVALGSPRFGARAGHRVRPSALPAPECSGMPEEKLSCGVPVASRPLGYPNLPAE